MKKSLSILLAFAMVLTMFASVSFAADELTAQEKFDVLKDKGIFTGFPDGSAGLDQEMTRAQFAIVVAKLLNLDVSNAPEVPTFDDVATNHWAYAEIEAGVAAELFVGVGNNKFNDKGNVTIQEIATVLAQAFDLDIDEDAEVEGATKWAAKYVKAALEAGLLPEVSDYTANATRSQLVVSSYSAAEAAGIIVPETVTATAAQTGAKIITVSFNKAISAADQADLAIEVKHGFVPYTPEATWSEDGKSVALENSFGYPVGDYTITVGEQDPIEVKVVAEAVVKIEIGAPNLQVVDDQDLQISAINQFGEKVSNASLEVSAFISGNQVASQSGDKYVADLATYDIGTTVVVTAINIKNGVSATKTYQLVAASTVTSMQFGPIVPLKDKTRITTGEKIEIPYVLIDQYGNKVTLKKNVGDKTEQFGDVYFSSSNTSVLDLADLAVDSDGKLTFVAGDAGTSQITVYNTKSGATATFQVKVEAKASVKSFTLSHPGKLIVEGEAVKFPFMALDQFNQPLETKAFAKADTNELVTFSSTNKSVEFATTDGVKWDPVSGELTFKFDGSGNTNILIYVGEPTKEVLAGQLSIEVKKQAEVVRVTGVTGIQTVFAPEGTTTIKAANINVIDNYGRTMALDKVNVSNFAKFEVATSDATVIEKTDVAAGEVKLTGKKKGSAKITIELHSADGLIDNSKYEFTATGIENSAVKSYTLGEIGVLYSKGNTNYEKSLEVKGVDENGNAVAINAADIVTLVTSSNTGVLAAGESVTDKVYGVTKGTSTIAVWKGAVKLAEQEVTVSDVDPIATSVKIKESDTVDNAAGTYTVAVEVKDQYGVTSDKWPVPQTIAQLGTFTSSNTDIATVSATGVVTLDATETGEVTISYVTRNGIAKELKLTVY